CSLRFGGSSTTRSHRSPSTTTCPGRRSFPPSYSRAPSSGPSEASLTGRHELPTAGPPARGQAKSSQSQHERSPALERRADGKEEGQESQAAGEGADGLRAPPRGRSI